MTEPHNSPPTSGKSAPPRQVAPWMTLAVEVAVAVAALGYLLFKQPDLLRTIATFLVTLGVLVFVHEWGHYQFARWAGMKVNRFAIGFPPFIFNRQKNGITYSIGALPIGGMVDIAGLGSEEEMVHTAKGEVAAPLRDTSRAFGQKQFQDGNLGWRFLVLFAGPLMNFLFAIVAFVAVYTIAGNPIPLAKPQVISVMAAMPAAKSGLKSGDFILKVGGKAMRNPDEVTREIRARNGQPIPLTLERNGKTLETSVTPVLKDLAGNGKQVPSIGISFGNQVQSFSYEKLDPMTAIGKGFDDSMTVSLGILDTIKRAATRNLSSDEAKQIGGPVKIAQTVGQASQFGWPIALHFAAMLSVNLGLMNLLPLPALDGGRILFLGYELVARRPFNPKWEGLVHAAGMIMLLAFMLFITLRDVASL